MRYAGLILICLPTALAGIFYSVTAKKRAAICRLSAELLRDTDRFIAETGRDVLSAMKYISKKSKYSRFSFAADTVDLLKHGEPLPSAWQKSILADGEMSCLPNDALGIILSACECFESPTKRELSERLGSYAERLSNESRELSLKYSKNGSVAVGLSILGATALFIILV